MHETHREEYGALRTLYRLKSRELQDIQDRIRVFEDACVKCGTFITEEHRDWDYEDDGEIDGGNFYGPTKIEFTICPTCGDKHIVYEG